jgi:hypothetical protein
MYDVFVYVCMHACMYVCMYVRIYVCVCVCVCVCKYVCVCIYIYIYLVCVCVYIHRCIASLSTRQIRRDNGQQWRESARVSMRRTPGPLGAWPQQSTTTMCM